MIASDAGDLRSAGGYATDARPPTLASSACALARPARCWAKCPRAKNANRQWISEGNKVDFFDGSWVQHIVANYSYAAIFTVVMLESAGVPLPGETILVSAAAFAGNRHALDIRYVIAAAAGGAILGDNIGF